MKVLAVAGKYFYQNTCIWGQKKNKDVHYLSSIINHNLKSSLDGQISISILK